MVFRRRGRETAIPRPDLLIHIARVGSRIAAVSQHDIIEIAMTGKHAGTLQGVFEDPVRSNIPWRDIESMIASFGGEITEGSGSHVQISLNGVRAVIHRPYPAKETDKGAAHSVRRFLTEAGNEP